MVGVERFRKRTTLVLNVWKLSGKAGESWALATPETAAGAGGDRDGSRWVCQAHHLWDPVSTWGPGSQHLLPADVRLVSEHFSQAPQKLAFYGWYGSAALFHFRVPPDTVLLRWLLQVSRGGGPACTNVEITV